MGIGSGVVSYPGNATVGPAT
ncbi:hypothetical protein BN12_1510011 [Nostocoides japonicum T1-X7]|uniref:Uncharacterized protein n=1 Tax=Nostocoides japonicum T1-X7 TaxID=1194083 RepID=A0A077LTK0_9MICO|nr:hypothetical protein BN12_1510011 [Tetrasphaera japonica T1-X7]